MCINLRTHSIHLRALTSDVIESQLEGWTATITDELLAGAIWSADSRAVLCFSEMQLYANVWSLTEQALVARFESPKLLPPKGLDFSEDSKFMALLQKTGPESRTMVSLYYGGANWELTN